MPQKRSKLLVINPNSTTSITDSLRPLLEPLVENVVLEYFTGPVQAPASINGDKTSQQSLEACLPLLEPIVRSSTFDGYLIACYSAHPLVPELKKLTNNPVVGIFEASITMALLNLGCGSPSTGEKRRTFGVVTTGSGWVPLLTESIQLFLGLDSFDRASGSVHHPSIFTSVQSTGLNADELHSVSKQEVETRMKEATERLFKEAKEQGSEIGSVCLGCAGMSGLEEIVNATIKELDQDSSSGTLVVDPVKAGLLQLISLAKLRLELGV